MSDPWHGYPLPPMRHEALYGDRVVRCFAGRPPGLWAMFEAALRARPAHEAMVCDDRRWSYRAVADEAERLAAGFAARGIGTGDRVLMLLGNRAEFVFVLLALQRLGAIAVPVGIREQAPGLAYVAAQCGACAIVFDDELAERVPELPLRLTASGLAALGADANAAAPSAAAPAAAARQAAAPPSLETETAVILYTSGTTGRPKGAMLTRLAIAHSALHYQACMRLGPDDRSALAVPASHVTGLIAVLATMWQVGGTVVVVPAFKAADFVALLARERVTHTLMVPAMYSLCLLEPGFASADLSAWRTGGYGGAPMPVATIDALGVAVPALVLLNCYGATETTSPATVMPAGRTRAHADSVGVALPCAEIHVMDEAGREVAPGETGELWIGGPMVVPGD